MIATLCAASRHPKLLYHFTVLDPPVINAFDMSVGYPYIKLGLSAYLSSQARSAGMLGDEINHVAARHRVRLQSTSQVANLA